MHTFSMTNKVVSAFAMIQNLPRQAMRGISIRRMSSGTQGSPILRYFDSRGRAQALRLFSFQPIEFDLDGGYDVMVSRWFPVMPWLTLVWILWTRKFPFRLWAVATLLVIER